MSLKTLVYPRMNRDGGVGTIDPDDFQVAKSLLQSERKNMSAGAKRLADEFTSYFAKKSRQVMPFT